MLRSVGTHLRVIANRQDLAVEGDGLLAEALRIADVAHDDLVEVELGRVALEFRLDLAGFADDGASDSVLHAPDFWVDGVNSDTARHPD